MTTLIDFLPVQRVPFTFQVELDSNPYSVVVSWNVFGQRWYVNVYNEFQTLIFCLPMIGSPVGFDISLSAGYFVSTLIYRKPSNQFEIYP